MRLSCSMSPCPHQLYMQAKGSTTRQDQHCTRHSPRGLRGNLEKPSGLKLKVKTTMCGSTTKCGTYYTWERALVRSPLLWRTPVVTPMGSR